MDPRHSEKVDTRGVHPVMTPAGIMPGGSEMRHWHNWVPYPDPDAIARQLAAGNARTRAERDWEAEMQATSQRQMELGSCFRPAGNCTHEYACVRCPYLQVDQAELPRLLEIEDEAWTRLASARAARRDGEVAGLTGTLVCIAEKKSLAVAR